MTGSNEARLRTTLAAILEIDEAEITDNTAMDSVPVWDSLKHLHLILALEDQFQITLEEETALNMNSVLLIKRALGNQGVAFPD